MKPRFTIFSTCRGSDVTGRGIRRQSVPWALVNWWEPLSVLRQVQLPLLCDSQSAAGHRQPRSLCRHGAVLWKNKKRQNIRDVEQLWRSAIVL